MEKKDIRIQKTREAIRQAFQEMVCKMEYKGITIKKLSERARVQTRLLYIAIGLMMVKKYHLKS